MNPFVYRYPGVPGNQLRFGILTHEMLRRTVWSLVAAVGIVLTGCLNLKPAVDQTRYFILGPARSGETQSHPSGGGVPVGLGRIEIPDYLQGRPIAVREADNEIRFASEHQWAERLDKGIQRVLALDLGEQLGGAHLVFSDWRRKDVRAVVLVAIRRFETEATGRGVLEANWRVTDPAGEKVLRAGTSKLSREGPSFHAEPGGAVANLNALLADFAKELAGAVHSGSME